MGAKMLIKIALLSLGILFAGPALAAPVEPPALKQISLMSVSRQGCPFNNTGMSLRSFSTSQRITAAVIINGGTVTFTLEPGQVQWVSCQMASNGQDLAVQLTGAYYTK